MQIHTIETGRLVGNKTFLRGASWTSLLRRREDYEFPIYSYVIEHPEGLIAVDAGPTARVRVPRVQRRFVPTPLVTPEAEVGPRMRAAGLRPEDVRVVVATHLDWDHIGGVGHFPNAEVLVHHPEWEFATTAMGRMRYQPDLWPAGFEPTPYALDPERYGPFPQSKSVTAGGDVRIVPLSGHSIGQVGVVVETDGPRLLFSADHFLREDWFIADCRDGRLLGLGIFFRDRAIETSRRIQELLEEEPTVLLPSHDDHVPARVAGLAGRLGAEQQSQLA